MQVIPPEERVNMSLGNFLQFLECLDYILFADDLIKAQNKNKKAAKKTTPRKVLSICFIIYLVTFVLQNVKGDASAKTTPKKPTNVAKSVGGSKAKRSAAADKVSLLTLLIYL